MPATHMQTPIGPIPIRKHLITRFATMSDREIADETFKSQLGFINPEAFAELVSRGLCLRGDFQADVYRRITAGTARKGEPVDTVEKDLRIAALNEACRSRQQEEDAAKVVENAEAYLKFLKNDAASE